MSLVARLGVVLYLAHAFPAFALISPTLEMFPETEPGERDAVYVAQTLAAALELSVGGFMLNGHDPRAYRDTSLRQSLTELMYRVRPLQSLLSPIDFTPSVQAIEASLATVPEQDAVLLAENHLQFVRSVLTLEDHPQIERAIRELRNDPNNYIIPSALINETHVIIGRDTAKAFAHQFAREFDFAKRHSYLSKDAFEKLELIEETMTLSAAEKGVRLAKAEFAVNEAREALEQALLRLHDGKITREMIAAYSAVGRELELEKEYHRLKTLALSKRTLQETQSIVETIKREEDLGRILNAEMQKSLSKFGVVKANVFWVAKRAVFLNVVADLAVRASILGVGRDPGFFPFKTYVRNRIQRSSAQP